MLVADLLSAIERLAPSRVAQGWDNSGLQVGDRSAEVRKVLASLEITEEVLAEAVGGRFDTVITHHPLLFSGIQSLVEERPKEGMVRALVREGISVISCHTNLDAAEGGIADIAADALGLRDTRPLDAAPAGWLKLVGFVPAEAVDKVAHAAFAAGAGGIGRYAECAFSSEGTGWFTPGEEARPSVGRAGIPERTPEVRWETVLPRERAAAVIRSYVDTHPYEEPAFDLYPVEDVLPLVGIGRVGDLSEAMNLEALAVAVAEVFGLDCLRCCGARDQDVRKVGVLPGSGRGSVSLAVGVCDVLISGDFTYHDSEVAVQQGLSLVDVPHGGVEWWAFSRWCASLAERLRRENVALTVSENWRDPWRWVRA